MLARTDDEDREDIQHRVPESGAERDRPSNRNPLTGSCHDRSCGLQLRKLLDLCRRQPLRDEARGVVGMFDDRVLRDILHRNLLPKVGERSIDLCEIQHRPPFLAAAPLTLVFSCDHYGAGWNICVGALHRLTVETATSSRKRSLLQRRTMSALGSLADILTSPRHV